MVLSSGHSSMNFFTQLFLVIALISQWQIFFDALALLQTFVIGIVVSGYDTFVENTFVECTFVEGTLVEWNIGRVEHSSNGTFVERNIGRMEHWSNGTLVGWNIGRTEHWSNGTFV